MYEKFYHIQNLIVFLTFFLSAEDYHSWFSNIWAILANFIYLFFDCCNFHFFSHHFWLFYSPPSLDFKINMHSPLVNVYKQLNFLRFITRLLSRFTTVYSSFLLFLTHEQSHIYHSSKNYYFSFLFYDHKRSQTQLE